MQKVESGFARVAPLEVESILGSATGAYKRGARVLVIASVSPHEGENRAFQYAFGVESIDGVMPHIHRWAPRSACHVDGVYTISKVADGKIVLEKAKLSPQRRKDISLWNGEAQQQYLKQLETSQRRQRSPMRRIFGG